MKPRESLWSLLLGSVIGGLFWRWRRREAQCQRQEVALAQARAEAEAAEALKSSFLANMSHELRTPLNAIINFSEFTLSGDFGPLTEQQEMLQQRILTNGRHLLGLINDILDLATLEAGRIDLDVMAIDLTLLLEGVRSTTVGLIQAKEIEVLLDLPNDPLPGVWADAQQVRRILLDLLSNATKFTLQGRIIISARLQEDGFVSIGVSDTGIGIAPEFQAKIFETFYQIQSDLNREYTGTGLGLPICKRLVEMHGGTLTLESSPGVGSTFTFTLPAALTVSNGPLPYQRVWPMTMLPSNGKHSRQVVVVDDDPDMQTILRHTLEPAGWQVHSVTESLQAHTMIRQLQPHLILLDLQMPGLDGWTLLDQLHADPSTTHIPVMICSILEPTQSHVGVLQRVQSWLVKPIIRERLLAELERYAHPPAKVLVVDDDPDARTILRGILTEYGWDVREAVDGEHALAQLQDEQPDVMILDLMMPRMDGFELLQRLDSHPHTANLPVVVLTAHTLTAEERRWLSQRTQGYFQKTSFPLADFPVFLHSIVERDR